VQIYALLPEIEILSATIFMTPVLKVAIIHSAEWAVGTTQERNRTAEETMPVSMKKKGDESRSTVVASATGSAPIRTPDDAAVHWGGN